MERNGISLLTTFILMQTTAWADVPVVPEVDAQPLAANLERVVRTLEIIGQPLDEATKGAIQDAIKAGDVSAMQKAIDSHVFVAVHVNPEVRVKASRGPAPARIRQHGYTPLIVKVSNESTVARALHVSSPQGGAVFSGVQALTLARMASEKLGENLPEKLTNE